MGHSACPECLLEHSDYPKLNPLDLINRSGVKYTVSNKNTNTPLGIHSNTNTNMRIKIQIQIWCNLQLTLFQIAGSTHFLNSWRLMPTVQKDSYGPQILNDLNQTNHIKIHVCLQYLFKCLKAAKEILRYDHTINYPLSVDKHLSQDKCFLRQFLHAASVA